MKEEYLKWYSKYLSRDFEMLVFGHSGYPVIVFPTSQGRFYQNKDFGLIQSVEWFINNGKIKVYCPDAIDSDSWYNYSIHPADRVKTHIGYENLILFDVIEHAKQQTGFNKVALVGCSFGAYHAANLAFRHPDDVGYIFSMGGAFDINQFIMGYYDDNCYFNNPPDYLPELNDNWYLEKIKQMGIILGTGEHDICLYENIRLSGILRNKGIEHWLDIRQGADHEWNWWRQMFPEYISKINHTKF